MEQEDIYDFLKDLPRNCRDMFIFSIVLKIPPHIIAQDTNISLSYCLNLIEHAKREFNLYPEKKHDEAIAGLQELLSQCRPGGFF